MKVARFYQSYLLLPLLLLLLLLLLVLLLLLPSTASSGCEVALDAVPHRELRSGPDLGVWIRFHIPRSGGCGPGPEHMPERLPENRMSEYVPDRIRE